MNRQQARGELVSRSNELEQLRERYFEQLHEDLPSLPPGWKWRDAGPEVVQVRCGENEVTLTSEGSLRVSSHPGRPLTMGLALIETLKKQLMLEQVLLDAEGI